MDGDAMTSSLRMALREIRASWQRLLFFFICIAIGVGGDHRAALGDPERARRPVRRGAVADRGRHAVDSNRDFTPKVLDTLAAEQQAGRVTATSESIEIPTMVRPADPPKAVTRMVELPCGAERRFRSTER